MNEMAISSRSNMVRLKFRFLTWHMLHKTSLNWPQLDIVSLQHCWCFSQYLGDTDCTNFPIDIARHFLEVGYEQLFHDHSKHSAAKITAASNLCFLYRWLVLQATVQVSGEPEFRIATASRYQIPNFFQEFVTNYSFLFSATSPSTQSHTETEAQIPRYHTICISYDADMTVHL